MKTKKRIFAKIILFDLVLVSLFCVNCVLSIYVDIISNRIAEKLFINKISSGASSDIKKASSLAISMVVDYNLTENEHLTFFDYRGKDSILSEKTKEEINKEIHKIITSQLSRAEEILIKNKDKVEKMTKILFEKEVLFEEELLEIMNEI